MSPRILVLGGTEFVGRAVVDDALRRGWNVTTLNRGSASDRPGVTALRGDRALPGGLDSLGTSSWDVVVDTWSGTAAIVQASARVLRDRAARYIYISSRSVYEYPTDAGADECFPLVQSAPDSTSRDYAVAKAGAELAVAESFGERGILARAGVILGPHENVGRLPWWLVRIDAGGTVAAPGPRDLGVQYVDARDLAAWCLDVWEQGSGPYNLVSPTNWATMAELLEGCIIATGSAAKLQWIEPERVLAAGIAPWTDFPLWLPPGELHATLYEGDVTRALASGLRCRPLQETIEDTWRWLRTLPGPPRRRADRPRVGIDAATEARLLGQL